MVKSDGLNVSDSDGVIRGERRKLWGVWSGRLSAASLGERGWLQSTAAALVVTQDSPIGDPRQPQ